MNLKDARPERFGSIASFFYRKLAEPTLAPMHRRIASEVPIERGRLLDVGCGPGQLTRQIARARPALSVVGLDPSEDMIRQAMRDSPPPNVEFRVGSPASAGSAEEFDFALSVLSFHHWEEPEEELTAIHRALRSGGRLWIYESDPEASNRDLRADRGPVFGWIRFPAALERYLSRGHGFTRREVEAVVAPAVARTPFRTLQLTRGGSTLRLELERRPGGA
jgi:SAM-dependent methyltransferase